jgi:NIMA (never in mitosis gene a)-related kinase
MFLTKDDEVKIGDLGIAKKLIDREGMAMTIIGTPYYLSPELVQGKQYNHKTDIWSLGVVLHELCTLRKPFDTKK